MEREIEDVITAGIQAAEGMVDGVGEIRDGTSANSRFQRW